MPPNIALKGMNFAHRALLKLSGGRKGWTAGGMPALELTTTGRKSGQKRAVMLTSPHQDGESMLIVASRGGDDVHPAWFLNLQTDPAVEVTTEAGTKSMTARVLSSDERSQIWPVVVAKYKNYGGYQKKTDREIPLVLLDPA